MRLDRLLANQPQYSRKQVRELLRAGVVQVNGAVCHNGMQDIDRFAEVVVGTQTVRAGRAPHYFMLHKPAGCVSATTDNQHTTVLDFFPEALRSELHIAGRLDLTSTGLMLLTNDGLWSRRLTLPGQRLGKVYRVRTEQPISAETAEVFARGIYFAFENLTTLPAELELLGSHEARLTLHEGRYHQIKRMFGHLRNKVLSLHREQMGMLLLDPALQPGQWRALSAAEIASV